MSNPAITLEGFETLSDDWYVLRKYRVRHRRRDGSEQSYSREAYDRGNGAAILLYDPARGTVFLTRQFRLPAYVNGHSDGMLMEVPAGLLDSDAPADAIRREAEEETGFALPEVEEVFTAYMSPGSVTERLHFFVAAVSAEARAHAGGGKAEEGEEIETIELPLGQALAMIRDGRIQDGKTIMLLQHAALAGLIPRP